jgi:hypothetical protein
MDLGVREHMTEEEQANGKTAKFLYYISYIEYYITYNVHKNNKNYSYSFGSPEGPSPFTGLAPRCA